MHAVPALVRGGVVVVPTDTLYGITACALNEDAVRKLYATRQRDWGQKCLILMNSIAQLADFGVRVSGLPDFAREFIQAQWPGPVSIELPVTDEQKKDSLDYLHKGTDCLMFRIPAQKSLREFLSESGPLLAPSANLPGQEPSYTCKTAQGYFGEVVDVYVEAGEKKGSPSQMWVINGGKMERLR